MLTRLLEHINDYLTCHRGIMWLLLASIVAALVVLVSRLEYKEQITDFLPVDDQYKEAMAVYQEVAAGDKVLMLIQTPDDAISRLEGAERVIDALEEMSSVIAENDSNDWVTDRWHPQIDADHVLEVFDFVYQHLPIYLEEQDYQRLDSALTAPGYIDQRLAWMRERLGMTSGSFLQTMMQHDPLNVGGRVAASLRDFQPEMQMVQLGGYLFTPDTTRCLVSVTSPFGSSESAQNARLASLLEDCWRESCRRGDCGDIAMVLTGSPVIAAGNSQQIQRDSLLAAVLAVVLILALLLWNFRSWRALGLILLTISFGFLFGLGMLSLFHDSISLIVVGMTSIIIGIAVNYPLHFLCHWQEGGDWRELVSPLLIGNVTTVGAFLTLVPLDAVATRDLGLFAALMLVGTIAFTLVFLPVLCGQGGSNVVRQRHEATDEGHALQGATRGWLVAGIAVVTAVLGWLSLDTKFDTNLNHINYMTDEQRSDLAMLTQLQGQKPGTATAFLTANGIGELERKAPQLDSLRREGDIVAMRNPAVLLPSEAVQRERLERWQRYWQKCREEGTFDYRRFVQRAVEAGFTAEAFEPFAQLMNQVKAVENVDPLNENKSAGSVGSLTQNKDEILSMEDFAPLTESLLTGLVRPSTGQLVAQLSVPLDRLQEVEARTGAFDMQSLNDRVLGTLTADFNYIGIACSLIVFLFLWLSFGSLGLACLAFLPMVIGWLWILGLMQLLDIQFNIVNIILATFIFGQGDDYTIFVVEGLVADYREAQRTGRPTRSKLRSYQRSILLSALIMFIGIGTLILAKHPALHSLATVTILGMGVVVLMAWLVPPLIFDIIKEGKKVKR